MHAHSQSQSDTGQSTTWTKKKEREREPSWTTNIVWSCDIMLDYDRSAQGNSRYGTEQMTLPCADHSWSSMISHTMIEQCTLSMRPHEINCVLGVCCGSNDESGGRVIFFLRPAGGDPGVDRPQTYFLDSLCFFEWKNLALLKPMKSFVWRGCGSSNEKQGEKLLLSIGRRWADWLKIDTWEKYSWNESTTSSAVGWLTRHQHGDSARPPVALRKVWFSTALSKKKANFVDSRKLLTTN